MEALENFPIDCWKSIFSKLDDDGLEAVSLVCKDFLTISNDCRESLRVVHPGIRILSKQLNRFKHLDKIDFRWFKGDLKEAILEIVNSEVRFRVLDISKQSRFEAENLKKLDSNSKMKNLKVLKYKGDIPLYDTDLEVISNSFPNLEELEFSNYRHSTKRSHYRSKFLTDFGLEFMASKLKFLKKIHMTGSHCFTDRSLVALSLNCAFLNSVTVFNCICHSCNNGVTENGIGILLRNSPNLESLSVGCIKNMDSSSQSSGITLVNSISHAKALNSLMFFTMDVSDVLLNAIANAKLPLKNFGLQRCWNYTFMGLFTVLSSKHLSKLAVSGADNLEDEDMKLLLMGDIGNLTHIDIGYFQVKSSTLFLLSSKCPSLIDIRMKGARLLKGGKNIPQLKHNVENLYLTYSHIDDESVQQFVLFFPNLRVVDLSHCYGLTSTSVEAILKGCKLIRKLILEDYPHVKLIMDDSEFPELIHLEDLDLSWSHINYQGLSAIAEKCPRLVSLNLRCCRNVTAEGIKHIVGKVTTLKCINIRPYYGMIGLQESDKLHMYNQLRDLLEWMLSTFNFASLKKIYVHKRDFNEEDEEKFLNRGCLLLGDDQR